MTEEKKSKNPFINLANEAKKSNTPSVFGKLKTQKVPKPSKGFGAPTMVKRSGRGG
jgi:hypothetical protein